MLPKAEQPACLACWMTWRARFSKGANGQIVIPGDVANRFQSTIRRTSESAQGFLKNDLSELRKEVLGAFNRSVSPDDAAALALTQKKYKAFKTVEPLLAKGEAGVAGREAGDVPAALLPSAVFNSYKGNVAASPLADLSKIGLATSLTERRRQAAALAPSFKTAPLVVRWVPGCSPTRRRHCLSFLWDADEQGARFASACTRIAWRSRA